MKETNYNDIQKFAIAVQKYFSNYKKSNEEERKDLFLILQSEIKDLSCDDFRIYHFRAFHQNALDQIDKAKVNIDKAIELLPFVKNDISSDIANCKFLFAPVDKSNTSVIVEEMTYCRNFIGDIYSLAGEIYAKIGKQAESFDYYKKALYYHSFFKSEFEGKNAVRVFSFRRFNQYTLADLINNEITVTTSTCMNDPFDSLINLWSDEANLSQTCKEQLHIKPMHDAFGQYRIRSFCMGKGNQAVKNILTQV